MGDFHETDTGNSVKAEASLSKVLVEVLAIKLAMGDLKEGQDVLLSNVSSIRRKIGSLGDGGMVGSPTTSVSPDRTARAGNTHHDKNVSFKQEEETNTIFSSADRISNFGLTSEFSGKKSNYGASMTSSSSQPVELTVASWPRSCLPRPAFSGDLDGVSILARNRSKSQMQILDGFRRPARSMSSGLQMEDSPLAFARRTRNGKCCILNPNSSFTSARELLSGIALSYDLVVVPFLMAWDIPLQGTLFIVNLFTASFWVLDILISFRTGYITNHGKVELDPSHIFWRYFRRSFLLDLFIVSADWISLILKITSAGSTRSSLAAFALLRLSKIMRCFRILRVARVAKVLELFSMWADRFTFKKEWMVVMDVTKLFLLILWVNHIIGCTWYAIGKNANSDTGIRWLDTEVGNGRVYNDENRWFQYTTAFHWSVCQMSPGSLQINPLNTSERIFGCTCLLVGLILFGALISALSARLNRYRMESQAETMSMRALTRFLNDANLDSQLVQRAQRQYRAKLSAKRPATAKDIVGLEHISQALRMEVDFELYHQYLFLMPVFRFCCELDLGAVRQLCNRGISWSTHAPGDSIFVVNEKCSGAFFLKSGSATYTCSESQHGHGDALSSEEDVEEQIAVHHGCWMSEAALWVEWSHIGTLEAGDPLETLQLSHEGIATTLLDNMLIRAILHQYAEVYLTFIRQAAPPRSQYPTDISVPNTDYRLLIKSLPLESRALVNEVSMKVMIRQRSTMLFKRGLDPRISEELDDGRSTLTLSSSGQVERVMALALLRVHRPEDEAILVCLGTIVDSQLKAFCELPGEQLLEQEVPFDTIRRMLRQELTSLASNLTLTDVSFEVGSDDNSPSGIPTASLRHVFAGVMEEGMWNKLPKLPNRLHIRRCSTEARQTRFLRLNSYANFGFPAAEEPATAHVKELYLGTGSEARLYCWLPQRAWEWYGHKTYGQQRVESLLAEFDLSTEVIRSLQEQVSHQPEVQQMVV